MSDGLAANRFAPPRADVEDLQGDGQARMVTATRLSRLLAVLIDGAVPTIFVAVILVANAIPAYERYRQQHVPGIEPPPLGTTQHMTSAWVLIAGLLLLGFLLWSATLVFQYGQTVGKRALGIRVVRTDGSRVGFARFVFLRGLPVMLLAALPLARHVVGLVDSLLIFRASSRCLHDDIADTRVVTAESSVDATRNGDPKYAGAALRTISF